MGIQIATAAYESLRLSRKHKLADVNVAKSTTQEPKARTWWGFLIQLLSF